MGQPTLKTLGLLLRKERGERGIREVAKEIDISHATLSRVERGFLPDLENFRKICEWLEVDPGVVLRVKPHGQSKEPKIAAHFRKDATLEPGTAQALATLILAAQRALVEGSRRDN